MRRLQGLYRFNSDSGLEGFLVASGMCYRYSKAPERLGLPDSHRRELA